MSIFGATTLGNTLWRAAAACGIFFWFGCVGVYAADPLSAVEGKRALQSLRETMRAADSVHADFFQTKELPDANDAVHAMGRVSVNRSGDFRWEYFFPHTSGAAISGKRVATWSAAGGEAVAAQPHANPRITELARFAAACLLFDEDVLRKHCGIEAVRKTPPRVRLTPQNDHIRSRVVGIDLTFSEDGSRLVALHIVTSQGSGARFAFRNVLSKAEAAPVSLSPTPSFLPPEDFWGHADYKTDLLFKNGAQLYSAVLKEKKRRLPLLLYVWEDAGKKRCVALTETLYVLGSVAVGAETAMVAATPDSAAEQVLARLGEAVRSMPRHGPHAPGAAREKTALWTSKGEGWSFAAVVLTP